MVFGRIVAVVEDVTVRGLDGRGGACVGACACAVEFVCRLPSNCGDTVLEAIVADAGTTNGSCSCVESGSGVSATLRRLAGRAKGLLGRSIPPSCDGRLTNGDCLSGESIGEAGFEGG